MPTRTKKKVQVLSNKECLEKLIMASATLDCVIKGLKKLKLKKVAEILQECLEDVLRVAAILQAAVIQEKAK